MSNAFGELKRTLRQKVKNILRISDEYRFVPAHSIQAQRMEVLVRGAVLTIEADHATPLYETIAEIVDYDCYQLASLAFSGGGDHVILDIGANVGISALVMSRYHSGRIVCYEPMERNCLYLERNVECNRLGNVELIRKAVTKTNGRVSFRVEKDVSVSPRLLDRSVGELPESVEVIHVESTDLAGVFAGLGGRSVELMKLDCEGGEYDIVDQIDAEMLGKIRAITMEVHDLGPAMNLGRLLGQFREMKFQVTLKKEMFGRSNLHHILAVR
jgi:FkbM family methyltransferase